MGQPVSALAAGVQSGDGSRATAKVTTNTRAQTQAGPVGLVTDIMQFPGPSLTGNWIMGSSRVTVLGIPVVNQASTGTSYSSTGPTGPMTVVQGDARVSTL